MDQTEKVIRFVKDTRWSDLPEPVKHQSKRCLLDTLGALLAGTQTPVSKLVAEFAQEQYRGEQATIFSSGNRSSLVGAALANGFAANALDIDDGYRLIKGHPGATIVPVVLAAGERFPCSGEEFLTALVVGYEIAIRAGLIRHATSQTYHSSGSWGAIGGAAAAARLMGVDEKTLWHALGTAEYHAPIAPMMKGIDTPSMGKDSIGWGCMVAMSAVLMAQRGFTGVRPLFDDAPEAVWLKGLGHQYEITQLYFKPYAACRWAQPAVEGMLKICREAGVAPADIRAITICTFAEAAALSRAYPEDTESAQYNMSFPIAAALIDGAVGPGQVLPPRLFDGSLRQMMDKVTVIVEDRFQKEFPAKALAEVMIETNQGCVLKSGVISASWDPASRLPTDAELTAKFHWLVDPVVGAGRAGEIEMLIWRFDTVGSPIELIKLMGGAF